MDEMDEVINEFLVESYENLDQLDADLLALEDDPSDTATLASIFRTIHTIKGTCGFLGFSTLESVAHVGENLLAKLRDGALSLTPEMTSALLRLSDAVREMLASIEQRGDDGAGDYSDLVEVLGILHAGGTVSAADAVASVSVSEPAEAVVEIDVVDVTPAATADAVPDTVVPVPAPVEPVVVAAVPEPVPEPMPAPVAAEPATPAKAAKAAPSPGGSAADSTIRVDVGVLDDLMTLVGELVLARNRIVQLVAGGDDADLAATAQHLSLITTELQEGAMKTRMQPIGNIWAKFPRVVRDLAVACGKEVRVEMEGEDTELDKTIIESIKDPLTHLVRNAVDHGVETAEARRAVGKPVEGRLLVRAFHEGGQVNIEISDDGAGIDPAKLRAKALERGIVTPEAAERMSDREVVDLIFAPGFSTAAAVTNVSGRGVGMDVVRTNIERIGGTVDVQSLVGEGTTFRIKIPLTLAIIPGLVVTSGENRYAIPQVSLLELVRLDGRDGRNAIELVHGAPVYRLRGNLLPLVHLHAELGDPEPAEDAAVNIVVLQADGRQFGLVVDTVQDSVEIVVKPLGSHLKAISTFAGATIMGDGRVGLILDVLGLAQKAHVIVDRGERGRIDSAVETDATGSTAEAMLLFATSDDGRMAVPLRLVDRLEEIDVSAVEHTGDHEVVQYRGEILPILRVTDALPERRRSPRAGRVADDSAAGTLQIIVHRSGGRTVGLLVERILDVVEVEVDLSPASRPGVMGTVVVDERVTEVLDLPGIVAAGALVMTPTRPTTRGTEAA
jgi:two-component system, chemotaxis family, sensor kinase CheA